jgi:hypothetical protein
MPTRSPSPCRDFRLGGNTSVWYNTFPKELSMADFELKGIPGEAAAVFQPFAQELLAKFSSRLLSLSVTGSCITGDFVPGQSDINSVLVLTQTDQPDLDILAAMSRFKKRRIRSPLIMTEDYIRRSQDVFPIEFLDIKLFHQTIYGPDHFGKISIDKAQLRLQCERDLKGKLINLQRSYVSGEGRTREIRALLLEALPGFFALLRAMLFLVQAPKEPPARKTDVLIEAEAAYLISLTGLREIIALKANKSFFLNRDQIVGLFKEVYGITNELCVATDALAV